MKFIAYYLPQFHPTDYNDEWWGKGFTEWTNVAKSKPRFKGHHQPQIPSDLGFYDLRLEESRIAQAELAEEYGLYGFCYYHYWFDGEILLGKPLDAVLESGKPDFPFCLCWANEKWTKAWEAHEKEVLVRQVYSEDDRVKHIHWLCNVFKDKRYIKINNKPVLLIYRIDEVPDLKERIIDWQKIAKSYGFDGLYICCVRNYDNRPINEILNMGIDAMAEHQPSAEAYPKRSVLSLSFLAVSKFINFLIVKVGIENKVELRNENRIFDYKRFVKKASSIKHPSYSEYKKFPCVFPSWDNSSRKKKACIIQNNDSKLYQSWLNSACEKVEQYPEEEQIVFINAWNEWAEGCHLEPDLQNGKSFLEATKSVYDKYNSR